MKKGGRPNKYDTDVKPRFEEIAEWLKIGATDKEIAENLGINKATICEYKKRYPEFNELIKNGRKAPVQAIKAALFKRATGFVYSEKKVIRKQIVIDGEDDESIPAELVQTETYTKCALPDPASAMILLKHWDKESEWTQDPAMLKLKKKEFELKKEHMESGEW
jgi:hypothetical protein